MINKNSKILITGGSGLVGQNLTNRLIKEGYTNIRVNVHRRAVRELHDSVEYGRSDLQTYEGCIKATKDVDVVFHCAASTYAICSGVVCKVRTYATTSQRC